MSSKSFPMYSNASKTKSYKIYSNPFKMCPNRLKSTQILSNATSFHSHAFEPQPNSQSLSVTTHFVVFQCMMLWNNKAAPIIKHTTSGGSKLWREKYVSSLSVTILFQKMHINLNPIECNQIYFNHFFAIQKRSYPTHVWNPIGNHTFHCVSINDVVE